MSFWTNNYKPQQKHKFRLIFGNNPDNQIVWYARSCDLPKFDITYDRDLVGNVYANSEANAQWQPIIVEFYDHIKYISGPAFGSGELGVSAGMLALQSIIGQEDPATGLSIVGGEFEFNKQLAWTDNLPGTQGTPIVKADDGTVIKSGEESVFGRKISEIRIQKFMHTNRTRVVSDGALGTRIAPDLMGEEWVLIDPEIVACDWGGLDASSEEINTIKMTFIFKAAYISDFTELQTS